MMTFLPASMNRARSALKRLTLLFDALKLVWDAARGWTVAWFSLIFVQGIIPAANVYLTKVLVDRIGAALGSGYSWDTIEWILVPAALMAGLLIGEQVLGGIVGWIRTAQTELVTDHIKALVHQKASHVDLAFYDSPEYFDRLARANAQANSHTLSVLENLGLLLRSAVTLFGIAGLLLTYGVWVPLALVISTLPALWVVLKHNQRHHEWWEETTATRRWADYHDRMLTGRETAPEIRTLGLENRFRSAYVTLRRFLRDRNLELIRDQMRARAVASIGALFVTGAALAWMLFRAVQGTATLGDLALFYQAFNQGQGLMRSTLQSIGSLYANVLFLDHLFTFLRLEPQVRTPARPRSLPNPARPTIRFEGVSFRYPGSADPAIHDFDLTIEPGTTVAIVGSNGAGKSTIIKLLCRFYDPDIGRVTINGIDLRELDLEELRSLSSVMFQYPIRWAATAEENISFGDVTIDVDRESVMAAARAGGAHEFVQALPSGYETLLRKEFDGGSELSGGQWQRVALARAFYRNAPVVILDEPTSAMDSWAEMAWLDRFRNLVRGRTGIIVTHRFTTAMRADIIHVMEGGQIVEAGSHEELLRLGGRYATSWLAQTRSQEASPATETSANGASLFE